MDWIFLAGWTVTAILSWTLRDYGLQALNFPPLNKCLADSTSTQTDVNATCLGEVAVLRISFGNVCFFFLMAVLLLGVTQQDNLRMMLHTGLWPVKFVVWGGLIGSTFAMPNNMFHVYGQIARVLSCFYIIFQLVLLLDFIYRINEWLLERERCSCVIVGLTGLLIVGSFVGSGFLYKYYAPHASCRLNIFFITWNIVLFLVYGAISVSPLRVQSAGLLTSAFVFAYTTYYLWSALNSEPVSECVGLSVGGNKALNITAFVLTLLSVAYTCWSSSVSSQSFDLGTPLSSGSGSSTAEGDGKIPYRPDFFHLTFLLASAYLVMVFTGWDLAGDDKEFTVDKGWGSTWVKIVASWLCAALYLWSMVAHRVLQGRSFY
ncbi:hypothetical protein N2152v2_008888 [Parachlorella kessleri]